MNCPHDYTQTIYGQTVLEVQIKYTTINNVLSPPTLRLRPVTQSTLPSSVTQVVCPDGMSTLGTSSTDCWDFNTQSSTSNTGVLFEWCQHTLQHPRTLVRFSDAGR